MRSIIQKILKESRDYHASVFLIMSEDERFVRYNLHVAGENYFSGGPNEDGWESIDRLNDKTFQEFYVNQRKNAEGVISILPQRQLDTYKPKVVEYVMGYFRKDDMNNVFDQLSESEEDNLEWARDVISDIPKDYPIIGQVYRVSLPEAEKAIIDVLIVNIENDRVHDNTRATIYDIENTSIRDVDEFLNDYNKDDVMDLASVRRLLKGNRNEFQSGHWYPVTTEDSLFKHKDFDPYDYIHPSINESEEDEFEWVDKTSDEPFHHVLMRDNNREPMLMDEIDRIMFNPAVSTEDKRFLKIAYWLEDNDYYPEKIDLGIKTSYIEMVKQRHQRQSGKWKIGPELSDEELYQLSQTPRRGTWNGNFWSEQFMKRFKIK